DLQGVTPAADFDALFVNGVVSLSNATLRVALGYNAVVQSEYQIISNDGSDGVLGTFGGLPERSVLNTTNGAYQVSYAGGDGNDVVLTLVTAPPSITAFSAATNGVTCLDCAGQPGSLVLIESTESLTPPVTWQIRDMQLFDGTGALRYIDTDATNHAARFY